MYRLLIVDDEYGIRNGIATLFPWATLGIEVASSCSNGLEALEFLEGESADFILCDIRMPRMDGLNFARTVRQKGVHCDIVLISAYKDFEYARTAIDLGVRHFIVKPTGYEELHEVFSKLVAERRAEDGRKDAERMSRVIPSTAAGIGEMGESGGGGSADGCLMARAVLALRRDIRSAKLSSVAKELGMSPNYFSSLFHRETGRTFSEFLTAFRMSTAKGYLEHSTRKIYEISALSGYTDTKSFIRAFHRHFGEPPNAFRKKANEAIQENGLGAP